MRFLPDAYLFSTDSLEGDAGHEAWQVVGLGLPSADDATIVDGAPKPPGDFLNGIGATHRS